VPTVAVVGEEVHDDAVHDAARAAGITEVVSLVERFGRERAMTDTVACIEAAVVGVLADRA
ncbi:MAG TPA: hypothetical protein VGE43_05635, partial [Acidimicrobiales bacterium]